MLEMIAVTFDGAHAAERKLSDLRASQKDEWLGEVSVIEHDTDGRYSVKAKNPSVDKGHAARVPRGEVSPACSSARSAGPSACCCGAASGP